MHPRRLFWPLFLGHAVVLVLALAVCAWLAMDEFDRFYLSSMSGQLRALAAHWKSQLEPRWETVTDAELKQLVAARPDGEQADRQLPEVRVTLIAPDGTPLADSRALARDMESFRDSPEFLSALSTGWGEGARWSAGFAGRTQVVAVRVSDTPPHGAVLRLAIDAETITGRSRAIRRIVLTTSASAIVGAALLAAWIMLHWSRPLGKITAAARKLARGDLTAQVPLVGPEETAVLSRTLNQMRDRLARHLDTIDRQRLTLESMLLQLHEGVLLVDDHGRIVLTNPAAIRLLELASPRPDGSLEGLPVEQCVIDHDVQHLLLPHSRTATEAPGADDAASRRPADYDEVRLTLDQAGGASQVLVRASNIVLPGDLDQLSPERRDTRVGRLMVLTDVSEFSRMMEMKADFAANASHELRTPLSAIRAAVETLDSVRWNEDEAPARHFLDVIRRHSQRLEDLVKDLLDLSRVESPSASFDRIEVDLVSFLDDLRSSFANTLVDKQIAWRVQVRPELRRILASPHLLRLSLGNLVDNAIKFTSPGGWVSVSADGTDSELQLAVADNGCGIPQEDLDRVFERFYQVQRSRSGQPRGTGLGLSIVRHAVAAMKGQVTLTSAPGTGTTVTVTIPRTPLPGPVRPERTAL